MQTKDLPEHLAETLAMVKGKKGVTALELHSLCPRVAHPAFCQRLAALRALDLVRRERHGKFYRYFRV